jgi:hypothetical protein
MSESNKERVSQVNNKPAKKKLPVKVTNMPDKKTIK